ncbi:GNAT family N-acetyltransferase [Paenibacillus sp. 481]|uniref:GNAT family N-acetyltransferase n=1 Tax=Paenibacillus sp. 481 TaxID=2835869 RepID=UPI001E383B2A|nr:GNAT family N-acetyltransferase [Paenibacillus sp. 481]UHA73637.1 GNAT family N-acetyltransferase [Paenibacillus sp. 481]
MIDIREMQLDEYTKLNEIDRSESINLIYVNQGNTVVEVKARNECPNWDDTQLQEIQDRFQHEIAAGGLAYGAFVEDRLVGFGVLGHKWRGRNQDQLQVDLMYVSRQYRRQGIGAQLIRHLRDAALSRGAAYLYISSTETESAVNFYRACGSQLTPEVDSELFAKEPEDIHMIIPLTRSAASN